MQHSVNGALEDATEPHLVETRPVALLDQLWIMSAAVDLCSDDDVAMPSQNAAPASASPPRSSAGAAADTSERAEAQMQLASPGAPTYAQMLPEIQPVGGSPLGFALSPPAARSPPAAAGSPALSLHSPAPAQALSQPASSGGAGAGLAGGSQQLAGRPPKRVKRKLQALWTQDSDDDDRVQEARAAPPAMAAAAPAGTAAGSQPHAAALLDTFGACAAASGSPLSSPALPSRSQSQSLPPTQTQTQTQGFDSQLLSQALESQAGPAERAAQKKRQREEARAAKAAEKAAAKAAKEDEKARKKAERDAAKADKAASQQAARAAKAAESRAKGSKALDEIEVVVDAALVSGKQIGKTGRHLLDELDRDGKFRKSVEAGKLPGYMTITWRRTASDSAVRTYDTLGAMATTDVPYIMIVLPGADAQLVFATAESLRQLLSTVHTALGEVTVTFALLAFERHLLNLERREHDAYVRRGVPLVNNGIKKACKQQLLTTALHYQGVTQRDCHDDAQLSEHVLNLTRALAEQPYKGGSDWLATQFGDGKAENKFKQQVTEMQLSEVQGVTAKALYKLKGVGPMEACLVAQEFGSFAGLMKHFAQQPRAQACKHIAQLQRANGRKVGPAAADKLWGFCTSEDGDAMYAEAD